MEHKVLEYRLSTGLLGRKRTLRLAPDYLEYENREPGQFTKISKSDIIDVKNEMSWILWYRFYVGCSFSIDIKTKENGIIKVKFTSYFGQNRTYIETYASIVDLMWQHYLNDIVNSYLQKFFTTYDIELRGVRLTGEGVYLSANDKAIVWREVALKEYEDYFAIYSQPDPLINKRILFNQWESDILFSLLQSLTQSNPGS
ncbi:hypothetical protein ACFSKU_04275 [Pontibacter silvestris]|uniref:Uncharacterized protein n=1 Tax=Pontibacter silvestris TaxID=2305183 RepID=A0ABW4WUR4_9BACT|nr:hypothetical protein [Pontibacter silvestris]MCC9137192.1 hypothetical protein [Pontibacter silvestris]